MPQDHSGRALEGWRSPAAVGHVGMWAGVGVSGPTCQEISGKRSGARQGGAPHTQGRRRSDVRVCTALHL